ncbi:kinase-like protein [Schizopora paradoxa]|uniref:Kinase-like protein n=1 Tax=Schizopora paradoxa TaxID=27342 RepID=A0A0H2RXE4_9AGAM|nr:kinase-like protein [Schizopora paradoxa]
MSEQSIATESDDSNNGSLKYADQLNRLLDGLRNIDLSGNIVEETPHLQASGGYCDVFIAKSRKHGNIAVAVKRLRFHIFRDKDASKAVLRELRVWYLLCHPNVLPLLGFVMHGDFPALVSQWMVNGSVRNYMEKISNFSMLLHMVRGIAAGLLYLHDKDIIHSDLKSDNILVSDAGEPLLADFGVSRIMHMTADHAPSLSYTSTGIMGTSRWMAIELWQPSMDGEEGDAPSHTKETDVWAFGMVVYELLSGRIPFYHLKLDLQVAYAISNGQIPSQPPRLYEETRLALWSICLKCWEKAPLDRPTISRIHDYLFAPKSEMEEAEETQHDDDVSERAAQTPLPPESESLVLTHSATSNADLPELIGPSSLAQRFPGGERDTARRITLHPRFFAIHPFLRIDGYTSTSPLSWDVRLPPYTGTLHSIANVYSGMRGARIPNPILHPSELSLPATHPPTSFIEISIPQLLWKPFVINKTTEPSRRNSNSYISASDLLDAVYDFLREQVRREEWELLPEEQKRIIAKAFHVHCKLVGGFNASLRFLRSEGDERPSLEELEKEEANKELGCGLRRVDCLGGLTAFLGLTVLPADSKDASSLCSCKVTLAPPRS